MTRSPHVRQKNYLRKLSELSEEIGKACELTRDFCTMLRQLRGGALDQWMEAVNESGIVELRRLVESIKKDDAIVRAGLSLH